MKYLQCLNEALDLFIEFKFCERDFYFLNGSKIVWSSLQCYSVLSDILVKNELCIPLERGSNVLSTGKGFVCLSPPIKLKSLCVSVLSTKGQFRSVL